VWIVLYSGFARFAVLLHATCKMMLSMQPSLKKLHGCHLPLPKTFTRFSNTTLERGTTNAVRLTLLIARYCKQSRNAVVHCQRYTIKTFCYYFEVSVLPI